MNCVPTPFPTFLVPAGSKAGPPAEAVLETALFATAGVDEATETAATEATFPDEEPDTNPQPVLPA